MQGALYPSYFRPPAVYEPPYIVLRVLQRNSSHLHPSSHFPHNFLQLSWKYFLCEVLAVQDDLFPPWHHLFRSGPSVQVISFCLSAGGWGSWGEAVLSDAGSGLPSLTSVPIRHQGGRG